MSSISRQISLGFLKTPPLWTRKQFGIDQFVIPDIDPGRIKEFSFPSKMRLGHKMEFVFNAIIESQNVYKLIAKNIVVQKGKTTLGELDFLLRSISDGSLIHLELTYKFYLIDTEISEPIYQLVGPNRRDMFYTKLDKLKEHQFSLPFTKEGIETLHERGLEPEPLKQQACFKAQLFTPFKNTKVSIRPLNKSCICGFWIRFEELNSEPFKDFQYYIPLKEEWILNPYEEADWINLFNLLLEINIRMLKESSPMVWMRKSEGVYAKFFVVWW
ncbi:DUF1853 family protein [Muriicola soli]|uniref:DUF1853 family protein n=1 Tax=Muriicola soli TaxID=2507538 RepID=A0A411E940_9FLAO|nr:DUF1853 family protein [Muriicola soli]QBA64209.1 DUF1853 family protein [Muriicola soli]